MRPALSPPPKRKQARALRDFDGTPARWCGRAEGRTDGGEPLWLLFGWRMPGVKNPLLSIQLVRSVAVCNRHPFPSLFRTFWRTFHCPDDPDEDTFFRLVYPVREPRPDHPTKILLVCKFFPIRSSLSLVVGSLRAGAVGALSHAYQCIIYTYTR